MAEGNRRVFPAFLVARQLLLRGPISVNAVGGAVLEPGARRAAEHPLGHSNRLASHGRWVIEFVLGNTEEVIARALKLLFFSGVGCGIIENSHAPRDMHGGGAGGAVPQPAALSAGRAVSGSNQAHILDVVIANNGVVHGEVCLGVIVNGTAAPESRGSIATHNCRVDDGTGSASEGDTSTGFQRGVLGNG